MIEFIKLFCYIYNYFCKLKRIQEILLKVFDEYIIINLFCVFIVRGTDQLHNIIEEGKMI